MNLLQLLARLTQQEDLNFLLTNRIPRHALTLFMGWFSKIEQPLVRDLSIRVWKLFSDLDLSESRTQHFRSLHDCFTRQLREGARPLAPGADLLTSPCDAIIGACGTVAEGMVLQAKGFPYPLHELLCDAALAARYHGGTYVTLRLTSAMYHRFHAPADCVVEQVDYVSGDTWNVNPIALKRIERLFCKNERAILRCRLQPDGALLTIVPVAAILVASMRLHCLDVPLNLAYRGPNRFMCNAAYRKGAEMGWFEHGSTIIVFAPPGFALCEGVATGQRIRMGEALLLAPAVSQA
jgi:phosphatidylserine decarboxylase